MGGSAHESTAARGEASSAGPAGSAAVPPAYVPYGGGAGGARLTSSARLLASGVITLVESVFTALVAVAAGTGGADAVVGIRGDARPVAGLVAAGLTVLLVAAGIGGLRRTARGRTLLVIANALLLMLTLAATAHADGMDGVPFWLAIAGTAFGLAVAGSPAMEDEPSVQYADEPVVPELPVVPEVPQPAPEPPVADTGGFAAIE